MTSALTEIVVDCEDAERLAEFWSAVLGWHVVDREEGAVEIGDDGPGPTLLFDPVPDAKTVKNRVHLDVRARDGDQRSEVQRILRLGAKTIDLGQGNVSWVVLADPEGNEFCVLQGAP
jgi:catechol 2,3-dioxygenase-like lactoylglutathione lyase family enzyme